MSRTPETYVNKTAEFFRNVLVGGGILAWLLAWGAFANDASGKGVLCVLAGGVIFWIASKIKVRWNKRGEVGVYK